VTVLVADKLRLSISPRATALVASALVVALVIGVAAVSQPKMALGVMAAGLVWTLAFRHPVANLSVLLFLTAVVPYGLQNQYGVGGGLNQPGLLPSDLFLLAGLAWIAFALPSQPLDRRRRMYALLVAIFLAVIFLQLVHGMQLGRGRSIVGQEARVLLSFGTCLMALPLLSHPPSRQRLMKGLLAVTVALGAWGMLQWFGHFTFGAAGDVGVRSGVAQTSGGVGQLQGGLFAFPVAIVCCFAVLTLGEVRSRAVRGWLIAAIVLNAASCLVTFERSFWIDALAGIGFVIVTAPGLKRVTLASGLCAAAIVALVVLSVFAPATLTTAQQRLNSVGSYTTDNSLRYRVVESGFVYQQIRAHPLTGSALGASIFWGRPWAHVKPTDHTYSHDGFLWLAWKIGIPAAALLVTLFAAAVLVRVRGDEELLSRAVRRGAQGAILGLLIATLTFPSFSQLSIAPVMGVLLALAISPQLTRSSTAVPASPSV
jgi:O-Antigen ligase